MRGSELALSLVTVIVMGTSHAAASDSKAPDPLMGNWEGQWESDDGESSGKLTGQFVALGGGKYRANFTYHVDDEVGTSSVEVETAKKGGSLHYKAAVDLGADLGTVTVDARIKNDRLRGKYRGDKSGRYTLERVFKKSPTLGAEPPDGAVVLFDGSTLSAWEQPGGAAPAWKLVDGAMEVGGGSIVSKQKFTDFKLHLEFRTPFMPEARGQARGNSGVYLQGRYEVQVLDSFGLEPKDNECGGIYKQHVPRVNACLPPEQWQTYDITFQAARLNDAGEVAQRGRMTVVQNGITIHDDVELSGPTLGGLDQAEGKPGGIMLQDHGNPVRYRNVWVVPAAGE